MSEINHIYLHAPKRLHQGPLDLARPIARVSDYRPQWVDPLGPPVPSWKQTPLAWTLLNRRRLDSHEDQVPSGMIPFVSPPQRATPTQKLFEVRDPPPQDPNISLARSLSKSPRKDVRKGGSYAGAS